MALVIKPAMGWNIATARAGRPHHRARSSSSSRRGDVRPVIGRTVAFEELPAAVEAMAQRETTGRTIVVV